METSKTSPSFLANIVNEKYCTLKGWRSVTIKNLSDARVVVLHVSSFNLPVRPLQRPEDRENDCRRLQLNHAVARIAAAVLDVVFLLQKINKA